MKQGNARVVLLGWGVRLGGGVFCGGWCGGEFCDGCMSRGVMRTCEFERWGVLGKGFEVFFRWCGLDCCVYS